MVKDITVHGSKYERSYTYYINICFNIFNRRWIRKFMISIDNIDEISAVKSLLGFAGYELSRCPVCESEIAGRELKKVKCSHCGSIVSWRTCTAFENSKLSASQLLMMFDRFDMNRSDAEVSKELSIFITTVKAWRFMYDEMKSKRSDKGF